MIKPVRKAVFPVAGLGTRFLPATKAMPKEMLPIVDKPLIQYAVEEAHDAGIDELIFVTGRGKVVMENHFDYSIELERQLELSNKHVELDSIRNFMPTPGQISYTRQQKPLGLGHAVRCAHNFISDEPFAVLLADELMHGKPGCLRQMVDIYAKTGGNLVAVREVPADKTQNYGILDVETDDGHIVRARNIVEKPAPDQAPSNLAVCGRYILQADVMHVLENQTSGVGNEIQLTDAIAKTLATTPLCGVRFSGRRFDCGSKVGFIEANLALALERADMKDDIKKFLKDYV